ncbi:MAG TPA: hypothetical protein ENI67_03735 [Gammaproteobacteria bacterium]|nr:hypothetical protein [Gammaproteobacteria bacterium]
MWQKRLERAHFKWPRQGSDVITLTGQQLN